MAEAAPPGGAALRLRGVRLCWADGTEVLRGVDLGIGGGEVLALLGPSGCGKTTLLRVIAGLEQPGEGTVELGGEVLSEPGRVVAPEKRGMGMVFQDWALFPHLDVSGNVAFGLARTRRADPAAIADVVAMVGLAGLEARAPATLSGGQQQRVALGRALAPHPRLLLLDEPFSNLDAGLRARVRSEVRSVLADLGITTLLVTHDREEAFVLGDRIAVMRDGAIVQVGTAAEVYRAPADLDVAAAVGEVARLAAVVRGHRLVTACGDLGMPPVPVPADAGRVEVVLRPEQVRIEPAPPPGATGGPGCPAVVEAVEFLGSRTVHRARLHTAEGSEVVVAERPGPPIGPVGTPCLVEVTGAACLILSGDAVPS
jgi:iron(III) transport system ATP-binding protein